MHLFNTPLRILQISRVLLLLIAPAAVGQTVTTIDSGSGGWVGERISGAVINGNPALCYVDRLTGHVRYARNAAAALEACALTGADEAVLAGSLSSFGGAGRRFQRLGLTARGALVVDDYAHHPTEVAATVAAARSLGARRVVAFFQPHLYSRTQELSRRFGEALAGADSVVVTGIYEARERAEDFPGVSGLQVAEAAADAGGGTPVAWIPDLTDAASYVASIAGESDVILAMGAGNIDGQARRIAGA